MKSVLVVCPEFPYPPFAGRTFDVFHRIVQIGKLGYQVDVVATCTRPPSPEARAGLERHCRQVITVPNRGLSRKILTVLPFLSRTPVEILYRAGLAEIPLPRPYDGVLLDTEHVLAILDNPTLRARVKMLRVHDHMPTVMRELADNDERPVFRRFWRWEAKRYARWRTAYLERCENLLYISLDEMARGRQEAPNARHFFLPTALLSREPMFPERPLDGDALLFVGSFSSVNVAALKWYLAHVHPTIRRELPDHRLVIAGSTADPTLPWLRPALADDPRIELLLNVPDLEPLYARGVLGLNPTRQSTGVKLKTIQSVQNGVPVVCTPEGVVGSGLVDGVGVRVADDPDSFARAILELYRDRDLLRRIAREGQRYLAEHYDPERVLRAIFDELGL